MRLSLLMIVLACAAADHRSIPWPANDDPAAAMDALRVSVGSYPPASEFGQNTLLIPQSVVGLAAVPQESALVQAMGVAGYTLNGSPTSFPVGSFGFAGLTADGARGIEAHQSVVTNCARQACAPSSGFDFGDVIGHEIDSNLMYVHGRRTKGQLVRPAAHRSGGDTAPGCLHCDSSRTPRRDGVAGASMEIGDRDGQRSYREGNPCWNDHRDEAIRRVVADRADLSQPPGRPGDVAACNERRGSAAGSGIRWSGGARCG